MGLQKNVASQKWTVFAWTISTNVAKTGDAAQITGAIWIDGVTNTIDDTNPTELGHGYYQFDLAQAETNGNCLIMDAVSSTSGIGVIGCPMACWTDSQAAILKFLKNKWAIVGTQLIIYDDDGTTALYTFNLTNVSGAASAVRVYGRTPV